LAGLCYAIASPIVGILIKYVGGIYVLQGGFLISMISLAIFGPSEVLNFPDKLAYTIGGVSLLGTSMACYFVSGLSIIIKAMLEQLNQEHDNPRMNDKASALLTTFMSCGSILSPIVGGVLNDKHGFRSTCDILMLCSLIFGLFFFGSVVVPHLICSKKQNMVLPTIEVDNFENEIESDVKEARFDDEEEQKEPDYKAELKIQIEGRTRNNKIHLAPLKIPHRKLTATSDRSEYNYEPGTAVSVSTREFTGQ
jgi:MFS family permease